MTTADEISRALEPKIAEVLAKHEVSMVTRWLALIETVEADGVRGIWALTADGMTAWDSKGMLTHALDIERAATLRDIG